MHNFWEKSGWERADKHLLSLKEAPFQREFPFVPTAAGLYIIRGARQVGKSTWLKKILSHHTKLKNSCYYLSCENLKDSSELNEFLKSTQDRQIILLDEISFVQDWHRSIKHVIDSGDKRLFILTGSNSVDLLKGADRMPGRWGGGGEFTLHPMDLFEFQQMRKKAKWPQLTPQEEIELYFKIGGFPYALIEAGPQGKKPIKAIQTYQNWLEGDVLKLGKQAIYLKEICYQIAQTQQSTISLQKLAQRTQMSSHHTAQDYVSILENCFALRTLYAIDPDTGAYRFRKEKKFYFTDPLVYWAAMDWGGKVNQATASQFQAMAEMTAHEFLARRTKKMGYFTSRNGEVDFYSKENSWAIEVKWVSAIENVSAAYKKIPVNKKMIWSQSNFLKDSPENT